jgi:hypothetical protein
MNRDMQVRAWDRIEAAQRNGRDALRNALPQTSWQPIETAPRDEELLLGWWQKWPELHWEWAAGLAGSTKGGWLHGQATHWQRLPGPPLSRPESK